MCCEKPCVVKVKRSFFQRLTCKAIYRCTQCGAKNRLRKYRF